MLDFWMKRLEAAVAPQRLPELEPMRQVGVDPNKPIWAIGHLTATSPEVCMAEAMKAREAFRNIKMIVWC